MMRIMEILRVTTSTGIVFAIMTIIAAYTITINPAKGEQEEQGGLHPAQTDSYEEFLESWGWDPTNPPIVAPSAAQYYDAHPEWTHNPECNSWSRTVTPEEGVVLRIRIEFE